MARTLQPPGPLDNLEDAFDLLQRAPAAAWLRYLAGAAPLVVGLLFTWSEFSSVSDPGDNPALASFFLLVLLVWFYHCRQVFSGTLRRILSLGMGTPAARAAWALACFEGTKLLVMPVMILSLIPVAFATGFYRSVTVFAGQGLSAREATAKAWKSAGMWQRENFLLLAILTLLGVAVFANIALTVVVAPMLLKIFTAYESLFAQRGAATLGIQLPIICALTWLCFDPLLQAIYTVRAFRWEGLSSGEDLLVRIKRLAPLMLLAVILGGPLAAEPAVSRDGLNKSIDRTLQSREYAWRLAPGADAAPPQKDWFLDSVDRLVTLIQKGWKAIRDFASDAMDWIDRLLRPIVPAVERLPDGKPSAVRPAFYLFGILVLALAVVLLWKFGPRRAPVLPMPVGTGVPIDLNKENVLASDLPEEEWLRMADRFVSAGDLRLALRALYLGTLALLNHRGFLTIHACKSNRDYERELRRRARNGELSGVFHSNIRSFEQSWYGFHDVTDAQLLDYRENLVRLRG